MNTDITTVFVVATEWNRGADLEGAITIEGVYDNEVAARRAKWAAIREYIGYGHDVYGRRNDSEWDCDVTVESRDVRSVAPARVRFTPPCAACASIRQRGCFCRDKAVAA